MRTLALFPLLLAISPSRIRIRRITELFQSSFASKNLRSISSGMLLRSSNLEPVPAVFLNTRPGSFSSVHSQRPKLLAGFSPQISAFDWTGRRRSAPLVRMPIDRHTATGVRNWTTEHSGCHHRLQDIFVTGAFLAYASAGISRWRDILGPPLVLSVESAGPRRSVKSGRLPRR